MWIALVILLIVAVVVYNRRNQVKQGLDTIIDKTVDIVSNKTNEQFIKDLHPAVKQRFINFIAEVEGLGYTVIITSGYRSFTKQAQLKKENPRNATPGTSMHNYGMAIDLNLQKGTQWWRKATSKAEWLKTEVPQLAKTKYNFVWGGDFASYHDPIHFDTSKEYKAANLLALAQKQFNSTSPVTIQGNKVTIA